MMETLFDLETGRANRDAGLALVEEAHPTDVQRIRKWIAFFATRGERFTADDVRANLSTEVAPPAWGAAFSAAVKAGEIVEMARSQSRVATNNGRKVSVYLGAQHAKDIGVAEYVHTPPAMAGEGAA